MTVFLALNAIEFGLWRDRSQAPPGPVARRRSLPQGQIETAFKGAGTGKDTCVDRENRL